VKTIGNTTNLTEVVNLKKIAWSYILETQKDIQLSLSEIKRIRPKSPIGMIKTIERIFSNLDVLQILRNIFINKYDEFLDEIAYRFYSITSERMLFLTTGKPKDRYYHLLDHIFPIKRELENLLYTALVNKGKITRHEVKIDTTSTYFEGNGISLAMFGYSRDHRGDKKQAIILLVLIDDYPLFSYIFEGNRKDVTLFLQTVKDLKSRIKCERFTIFCDRGFFDPKYLDVLDDDEIFYIMAVPRRKTDWPRLHDSDSKEFYIEGRRAILYENSKLRKELLGEL
jgi:transposase